MFQLVVMIGVRKLLDFVFTKEELKILDDILPEFTRREKLKIEEAAIEQEVTYFYFFNLQTFCRMIISGSHPGSRVPAKYCHKPAKVYRQTIKFGNL
jgi:hypothetical protein